MGPVASLLIVGIWLELLLDCVWLIVGLAYIYSYFGFFNFLNP